MRKSLNCSCSIRETVTTSRVAVCRSRGGRHGLVLVRGRVALPPLAASGKSGWPASLDEESGLGCDGSAHPALCSSMGAKAKWVCSWSGVVSGVVASPSKSVAIDPVREDEAPDPGEEESPDEAEPPMLLERLLAPKPLPNHRLPKEADVLPRFLENDCCCWYGGLC